MSGVRFKKRGVESYEHRDKDRLNNPPVGLVSPRTDVDGVKKEYEYDPHIDPSLQWAGKAEHVSFEVDTVSLHVHERIDPKAIIGSVKRRNGQPSAQPSLWEDSERPYHEAIEFYKHRNDWSNRLIAGDSLLVMNSLLEKESMGGKVQMVYMDPPYGIKYGSNFQPFTNKRDVKDGKDEDLTAEPEMLKAFRDTWELGIHSYLTYMRDRLLLVHDLLTPSGSCFVQISDKNVHLVRSLMDEVFGTKNFVSLISYKTTSGFPSKTLSRAGDYIIQYAKNIDTIKHRQIYTEKGVDTSGYNRVLLSNGETRALNESEKQNFNLIPKEAKLYSSGALFSPGKTASGSKPYIFEGKEYFPSDGHWKTTMEGLNNLKKNNRIEKSGNTIRYRRFIDDFPVVVLNNIWDDTQTFSNKSYVVQTNEKVIQRCILMSTDPGDLVLDPTCGSGTTAYVAEKYGRRWITCDTSRIALTVAKKEIMTAHFDYYQLAFPEQGIGSGFKYKTVKRITLKSIANDEPPAQEVLYDQPLKDTSKSRVTGPFTVEAVPAPMAPPIVKSIDEITMDETDKPPPLPADNSVARTGETARQNDWINELLKTGIRGKGGQKIRFSRIELIPRGFFHADAETEEGERAIIFFGDQHAPLDRRQVSRALQKVKYVRPTPKLIIFAAFQFDPEAAKDIEEKRYEGAFLLQTHMNSDLNTQDLKKKRASNESFWLVGSPDVKAYELEDKKWQVEVCGFDYYDTELKEVKSGNTSDIEMWMLDGNYDGRSVMPSQVFFPMASAKDGWKKLARNLKAEIDEELIEAYRGTVSLPFKIEKNGRVAVKIIDNRGIESLKIIPLIG